MKQFGVASWPLISVVLQHGANTKFKALHGFFVHFARRRSGRGRGCRRIQKCCVNGCSSALTILKRFGMATIESTNRRNPN